MRGVYTIPLLLFACLATVVLSDVEYIGPSLVEENDTFNITCHLSDPGTLVWTMNHTNLVGRQYNMTQTPRKNNNVTSQLIVYNATANNTGMYRCSSFLTKYHFVRVIAELPKDSTETIILAIGKDNLLECNATGNLTWYKDGSRIAKDDPQYTIVDKNLTIINADDADAGTYVCESAVTHTFVIKTRARVEMLPKSINLVEGDPLNLTCVVRGNPMPTVEWFKGNEPVKTLNTTRIQLKPSANNVSDAVLYIEHLEDDDRADYMCSISNGVNEANTTVKIRVKDKLAALWPFLGIVAEVAILCTIILIYEKRRAKQEYDESDTDQNNESKPVADQKDKDVRQRK